MELEFLKKTEKKIPFEVPERYFDGLPYSIIDRINQAGVEEATTISLKNLAQTAVAACFAIFLGILGVMQVEKQNNSDDTFINIVNFDEEILIQEYLETYVPAAENRRKTNMDTYILNQVDESLLLQEL